MKLYWAARCRDDVFVGDSAVVMMVMMLRNLMMLMRMMLMMLMRNIVMMMVIWCKHQFCGQVGRYSAYSAVVFVHGILDIWADMSKTRSSAVVAH